MTRVINSLAELDQYIKLLERIKEQNGSIPDHILKDVNKAIYSTTYGLKLRFLVRIEEEMPEHLEYFTKEV